MRVASVDCGTNSLRLLVSDVDPYTRTAEEVIRRTEIVRLGEDVDSCGCMTPEAMRRALDVTREYAAQVHALRVERIRFVATSASRDARNAHEFAAGVTAAFAPLPVVPEVISGNEEALLSFTGATLGLRADGLPAPYLVVDLGGGSTELVLGTTGVRQSISLDIGSVRVTERHFRHDPPTAADIGAAMADIDRALRLARTGVDLGATRTFVGLGGTVTTIAAHALGLPRYERDRVHLSRVSVPDTLAACTRLLTMRRAQRAALGFMHPGRVAVIGAGALIWRRIVEIVAAESGISQVVTSEHDILDGIAVALV